MCCKEPRHMLLCSGDLCEYIPMIKKFSLLIVIAVYALSSGCLTPRPWWDREMKKWVGAPVEELERAWGPPRRTIIGDNNHPVFVYESHTVIDAQDEDLRDPSRRVSDEVPGPAPRIRELDCIMYFEIVDALVAKTWFEGAGCQVVIRRLQTP